MKSCLLVLFAVLVGLISANCGCLNCNKNLHVLSHPGSRIKVIHRNDPCTCPKSLPYSVETPVSPIKISTGRSYGFQIHPERHHPNLCPTKHAYDCHLQIPKIQQPKYLLGLKASTDRILLPPHKCQHPHIERCVVAPERHHHFEGPCYCHHRYYPSLNYVNVPINNRGSIYKPKNCDACSKRSKLFSNYKLSELNLNRFLRRVALQENNTPYLQLVKMFEQSFRKNLLSDINRKRPPIQRFKREANDGSFFTFSEENEESDESTKIRTRSRNVVPKEKPILMMQSMPLLKMLSIPLKYLDSVQDNPLVGAIPKVLKVSKRYLMNFISNFVDDYKRIKRKRKFQKRLGKREISFNDNDSQIYQTPLLKNVLQALSLKPTKKGNKESDAYYKFADINGFSWDDLVRELEKILVHDHKDGTKEIVQEFLSILREPAAFFITMRSKLSNEEKRSKRKRETDSNLLREVLKLIKAKPLSITTRNKRSTPELETNTIKNEISEISKNIRKLLETDYLNDIKIYNDLLKLDLIKNDIKPERVLNKIEDGEKLKNEIMEQIMINISKDEDEPLRKWIKTMIYLKKFACALKHLKENKDVDEALAVISLISFVKGKNYKDILSEWKTNQNARIQAKIEVLNNLKVLLANKNQTRIKEAATLIWESNNLKKLQRHSATEMIEKFEKKQKIRQELKILFHLQTQLESCQQKQKILFDETNCFNFKKAFKPPQHEREVNSDDCEILERSNFSDEDDQQNSPISLRFGQESKRPQMVYYPIIFNSPCCNCDKKITVEIRKRVAATQRPQIFCSSTDEGFDKLSERELRFLYDYLDDVETKPIVKPSPVGEDIVITMIEKSPPCKNFVKISDRLDFVKIKISDLLKNNGTHTIRLVSAMNVCKLLIIFLFFFVPFPLSDSIESEEDSGSIVIPDRPEQRQKNGGGKNISIWMLVGKVIAALKDSIRRTGKKKANAKHLMQKGKKVLKKVNRTRKRFENAKRRFPDLVD
ncbi:hypothetical protein FQA39_LY14881 [Lamprigera yunnana]|nr:hypothetical protein FQA39_LY14881 [Lamprigera yunnana]